MFKSFPNESHFFIGIHQNYCQVLLKERASKKATDSLGFTRNIIQYKLQYNLFNRFSKYGFFLLQKQPKVVVEGL